MVGASTQLLFELEEPSSAATTCGAGSRAEIRPTPTPQRRRPHWRRRQQPQQPQPTAAGGQALFGHSKGSSSGSGQQWRRLALAAPEMLPTCFGEDGGSGSQTRVLRSIYTQPGSRQSRGRLEGYAVRGVIGDESHCKPQTRVVLAQPLLLAQEEMADGGRWPAEGPRTPPVYPWGQRQPQGGWVEREQEGEGGEEEEERVAIKIISRAWSRRNDHLPPWGGQRPLGEAAALARLPPHPHVMPLLEAMEDGEGWIYLVFPFAEEELFETLVRKHPHGMPEPDARHYATQMALGLLHMKRHGLAHGDISLENAMLSFTSSSSSQHGPATLRLIDLEMARLTKGQGDEEEGRRCVVGGKPSYCAPECVTGRVPNWHAADAWSLGVCLYMLLTGRPLYRDPEDAAFALLAQGGAPGLLHFYASEYGLHLPPLAADLISSLLRPHPSERLTLEGLLLHPWMTTAEGDEDDAGTVIASSPSSFPLVGGGPWPGGTPPGRQQLWEEEGEGEEQEEQLLSPVSLFPVEEEEGQEQEEQLLSPVSLFPVEEEAEQGEGDADEDEAWGIYCDPDPTSPSSAYPSSFAPMCAE